MVDKIANTNSFVPDPNRQMTEIGTSALKPMIHAQVSMLRIWANSIERFAGNYEKGLEEIATTVKEQSDNERAA